MLVRLLTAVAAFEAAIDGATLCIPERVLVDEMEEGRPSCFVGDLAGEVVPRAGGARPAGVGLLALMLCLFAIGSTTLCLLFAGAVMLDGRFVLAAGLTAPGFVAAPLPVVEVFFGATFGLGVGCSRTSLIAAGRQNMP